jgi:hypothetical protein
MTNRTFISICLLALVLPVNELWHLWNHVSYNVNPWLARDYPLDIQWYVKFLCLNLSDVIKAVVIYRFARLNRPARIVSTAILVYAIIDLIMFFINFNQTDYTIIYSLTGVISILFSYKRKRKMQKEMKQEMLPA